MGRKKTAEQVEAERTIAIEALCRRLCDILIGVTQSNWDDFDFEFTDGALQIDSFGLWLQAIKVAFFDAPTIPEAHELAGYEFDLDKFDNFLSIRMAATTVYERLEYLEEQKERTANATKA